MNSSHVNLITNIKDFLTQLKSMNSEYQSLEWYLINNLEDYLNSIENAHTGEEIKKATRLFGRFCTESMNWDTPLYKKCSELTTLGFRLAKNF